MTIVEKGKNLWAANKKFTPIVFFVFGFILDVFTLGQVDDLSNIIQQSVFLVLIGILLILQLLDEKEKLAIPEKMQKAWEYRNEALHFLLGSLLSVYTIFYFISSSLMVSFLFMSFLAALLVLNEFPKFQEQGLKIKFALFTLCIVSFFSCLIPILLGFVGYIPLLITVALSCGVVFLIKWYLIKRKKADIDHVKESVVKPSLALIGAFLIMYVLKIVPPIPLSIQHIGIYHSLEREDEKFKLGYKRPDWKFWEKDSRNFLLKTGDRIFCFARIFSPERFKDKIYFHWHYDDPLRGWIQSDKVPMQVSGGRVKGFRGYALKNHAMPGDWVVKVKTSDGREIGRIPFTVEEATEDLNLPLRYDYH